MQPPVYVGAMGDFKRAGSPIDPERGIESPARRRHESGVERRVRRPAGPSSKEDRAARWRQRMYIRT